MDENETDAITRVIGAYFDALYFADPARMANVMHAGAIYATAAKGNLVHRTMDEYLAVLEKREPPAARGETRRDAIQSVTVTGPTTAYVVANCAIAEDYFTDLLTLVRIEGRWWIMSKVFDVGPLPEA